MGVYSDVRQKGSHFVAKLIKCMKLPRGVAFASRNERVFLSFGSEIYLFHLAVGRWFVGVERRWEEEEL